MSVTIAERAPHKATGYQMATGVDIKNFRSFDNVNLPSCRRINIIVGENGSGKTALLEAIFLATSNTPESSVNNSLGRGFSAVSTRLK
jgi:AAA15 family ATPase/GTPase